MTDEKPEGVESDVLGAVALTRALFEKLDVAPRDNYVSEEELERAVVNFIRNE